MSQVPIAERVADHPRLIGGLFLAALLVTQASAVAAAGGTICPDCAGP